MCKATPRAPFHFPVPVPVLVPIPIRTQACVPQQGIPLRRYSPDGGGAGGLVGLVLALVYGWGAVDPRLPLVILEVFQVWARETG